MVCDCYLHQFLTLEKVVVVVLLLVFYCFVVVWCCLFCCFCCFVVVWCCLFCCFCCFCVVVFVVVVSNKPACDIPLILSDMTETDFPILMLRTLILGFRLSYSPLSTFGSSSFISSGFSFYSYFIVTQSVYMSMFSCV